MDLVTQIKLEKKGRIRMVKENLESQETHILVKSGKVIPVEP